MVAPKCKSIGMFAQEMVRHVTKEETLLSQLVFVKDNERKKKKVQIGRCNCILSKKI